MTIWHLRLLGELALDRDGVTVRRFRAQKYGALFAFLALHPRRAFSRDELVDRFWPDADYEAGRVCLRTALASLRRQVADPEPFQDGGRGTVGIDPKAVTTDVSRFTELLKRAELATDPYQQIDYLRQALTCYAGPLLPGFYDDWIIEERERLEEVRDRAADRLSTLEAAHKGILPATGSSAPPPSDLGEPKAAPAILRLPLTATRFHGRDAELARLEDWLDTAGAADSPRLITLTGTAGMGKTRLCVEMMRRVAPRFSGAVCFVTVAACTEGEQIGPALADALRLDREPGEDPVERVASLLNSLGSSLLALDNLEQLSETGGPAFVRRLRASLPETTILVTSRQPLLIEGEQEFPLSGLPAGESEGLFADRAAAARPDFALTPRNQETVAALCKQLDGIPLAIELCASWASLLTPSQMRERMESGVERFALLVSRRRDIAARHRSLHTALEWNCPTDPELRTFFAACSVFRGGWTLEAAEALMGEKCLPLVAQLRERSLLVTDVTDTGIRYRYLATVRDFADELMTDAERLAARQRHCDYYLDLGGEASARLMRDRVGGFMVLDAEDANIRAALDFGLSDTPARALEAARLAWGLNWPWWVRGRSEFIQRLKPSTRLFARLEEFTGAERAFVLHAGASLAAHRGEYAEADRLFQEAILLFDSVQDEAGGLISREHRGQALFDSGKTVEGQALIRQAAERMEALGNMQVALWTWSRVAGNYTTSGMSDAWEETVTHCRALAVELKDESSVAIFDRDRANRFYSLGNYPEAERLARAALVTFRRLEETRNIADALYRLALPLLALGKTDEAHAALTESRVLIEQIGDTVRVADIDALLAGG